MAVDQKGRNALTHVLLARRTVSGSLLGIRLSTGRTHQIRAHLAAIGLPVMGDRLYGGGDGPMQLHAAVLAFRHPITDKVIELSCEPPEDFVIRPESSEYEALLAIEFGLRPR
jgi:23S rRNA pseudouridine1911/1915/1917 synthase